MKPTMRVLSAGAAWVLAQTDGQIHACVLKDGTLRIVPNPTACKKNETLLTWNIVGPEGDAGLACWDTNGDGIADAGEDINVDGAWDARDCQGPQGGQGLSGESQSLRGARHERQRGRVGE